MKNKFCLVCQECGKEIESMEKWFKYYQTCDVCGSRFVKVEYADLALNLQSSFKQDDRSYSGLWRYKRVLPITDENHIISSSEGSAVVERWRVLEELAKEEFKIECNIYAHRQDCNCATGTFKDLSGAVVASVLNEINAPGYVAASTGNIAVAYARYLGQAGIKFHAFLPENSSRMQFSEITSLGQTAYRVQGDYDDAKRVSREFAKTYDLPLAAGNLDPMRIEAKKTMTFEWLRQIGKMPSVYVQGLSGGTGPIAIQKAVDELRQADFNYDMPRFLLVQSDQCSPMADAWYQAKKNAFPDGWETDYPSYKHPDTNIATLSTGNPTMYPFIGPLVRESGGQIIAFPESVVSQVAYWVALTTGVRVGPAAAIPVGGVLQALKDGFITDGDNVLVNVGEGMRRAPELLLNIAPAPIELSKDKRWADFRNEVTTLTDTAREIKHKLLESL